MTTFTVLYPRDNASNPYDASEPFTRMIRGDGVKVVHHGLLLTHYLPVAKLDAKSLDGVFATMNGHGEDGDQSPAVGSARLAAMAGETDHTSMSVGDIAVNEETGEAWVCDSFGWKIVERRPYCPSCKGTGGPAHLPPCPSCNGFGYAKK